MKTALLIVAGLVLSGSVLFAYNREYVVPQDAEITGISFDAYDRHNPTPDEWFTVVEIDGAYLKCRGKHGEVGDTITVRRVNLTEFVVIHD